MLPPPPHNKIFYDGQNLSTFFVLILPEWRPFQLEIISHLPVVGQPRYFHCGEIDF